jgi:hypothetical protein
VRRDLATVACVSLIALCALWAKTYGESRESLRRAEAYAESSEVDHRAHLGFAAQQGVGLGRPEGNSLQTQGSVAGARGVAPVPSVTLGALSSLLFLLWLGLAVGWVWVGHRRDGTPTARRWPLAAACATVFVAWVVSAFLA